MLQVQVYNSPTRNSTFLFGPFFVSDEDTAGWNPSKPRPKTNNNNKIFIFTPCKRLQPPAVQGGTQRRVRAVLAPVSVYSNALELELLPVATPVRSSRQATLVSCCCCLLLLRNFFSSFLSFLTELHILSSLLSLPCCSFPSPFPLLFIPSLEYPSRYQY